MEYQVIKDNQTAIMAFESGTVDFVTISSDQVALYEGSEAFLSAPSTTSCYIVPNFEDPTLQNQNLLYAIGFSIDRDSLTQNILADGSVAKYDCNYTDCFFGPDGTEFNSAVLTSGPATRPRRSNTGRLPRRNWVWRPSNSS